MNLSYLKNFFNKKSYRIILILVFTIFLSHITFASSMYYDAPYDHVVLGGEFSTTVMLDSEGKSVNAFETDVIYSKDVLQFVKASYSDSIVNQWLQKIVPSDTGVMSISGIVPGGFNGVLVPLNNNTKPGVLVTLTFRAIKAGNTSLSFNNSRVLLNDGKATPDTITTIPVQIVVPSNTYPENSNRYTYLISCIMLLVILVFYVFSIRKKI